MVWIGAALGVLFGIWQAKKSKGKPLDMAQYGAVYGILFALIALIVNVAIIRQTGG
ncbi:hypothetical protein [Marimonas arenosa]|uniref:Apolipoprotein acyltransferase n=1 Tax=Marimonas arenosa TaxID=1795305 RepID=A0AAE4B3B6_9RHOB|nr:hypothetical protein [Marimonas arenosa]MDQ2089090.1 hypothetical protein [Marimonas arenosa]